MKNLNEEIQALGGFLLDNSSKWGDELWALPNGIRIRVFFEGEATVQNIGIALSTDYGGESDLTARGDVAIGFAMDALKAF